MTRLLHSFAMFVLLSWTSLVVAAPLPVTVSLPPQGWLLERLAGPLVQGQVLADKGQDPHTFEPTPKQVAALAKAKLYFTVGLPFEEALAGKLPRGDRAPRVIDTSSVIEKIAMTAHGHDEHQAEHHEARHEAHHDEPQHPADAHHGHDDEGGGDPHIWLSCRNLIRMAEVMGTALIEADPAHADSYRSKQQALTDELAAIDREIGEALSPHQGATFYVFHPAFGYFAHDYGLEQEAVELGGKTPSPKQLNAVIARAREDKVKVLFVQPQFDSKSAQVVAEAIGGRVEPLDPLAADVPANLRRMAREIAGALAR
ncbi:MAG: hypothetical protein BWK76_19885 [Desulfobulbaceae bacterium A2]|nr:MAG: hypothetical protein BWK76_19885 [Desulfobulbaceae bacterium A2]